MGKDRLDAGEARLRHEDLIRQEWLGIERLQGQAQANQRQRVSDAGRADIHHGQRVADNRQSTIRGNQAHAAAQMTRTAQPSTPLAQSRIQNQPNQRQLLDRLAQGQIRRPSSPTIPQRPTRRPAETARVTDPARAARPSIVKETAVAHAPRAREQAARADQNPRHIPPAAVLSPEQVRAQLARTAGLLNKGTAWLYAKMFREPPATQPNRPGTEPPAIWKQLVARMLLGPLARPARTETEGPRTATTRGQQAPQKSEPQKAGRLLVCDSTVNPEQQEQYLERRDAYNRQFAETNPLAWNYAACEQSQREPLKPGEHLIGRYNPKGENPADHKRVAALAGTNRNRA